MRLLEKKKNRGRMRPISRNRLGSRTWIVRRNNCRMTEETEMDRNQWGSDCMGEARFKAAGEFRA
jgi:hypothetical protein